MIMKTTVSILLSFVLAFATYAQNLDKAFSKFLPERRYDKAHKIFDKAIEEDFNNALANYGMAIITAYGSAEYHDLFASYFYIQRAKKKMDGTGADAIKALQDKVPSCQDSINKHWLLIDDRLAQMVIDSEDQALIERFIEDCPQSRNHFKVSQKRIDLNFRHVTSYGTMDDANKFIRMFPYSDYVSEVIKYRDRLNYQIIMERPSVEKLEDFIHWYPKSEQKQIAMAMRDSLAWEVAKVKDTYKSYDEFLMKYPFSKFAEQAVNNRIIRYSNMVQATLDPATLQSFINLHPNVSQTDLIIGLRDRLVYERIKGQYRIDSLNYFISYFPLASEQQDAIKFRNKLAFEEAKGGTNEALEKFILRYASTDEAEEAIRIRDAKLYAEASNAATVNSLNKYLSKYPFSSLSDTATKLRNRLAFMEAREANTYEAYLKFITLYPMSEDENEARELMKSLQ